MMKSLILFATLFCISAGLFAQSYTVSGTVTNKQTGEPLHSAVVELDGKGGQKLKTLSGLNGAFVFKNVQAGDYEVETEYVGFKKIEVNISVPGNAANVQLGLEEKKEQLKEVTVTTTRANGTDASAFLADRRAPAIQNSVSARTIEISPDLSVANVTQRVSGVSLERSANGEGQYAILRGMDKRYNYTLVNGIKIPSPDNKNRYIPLDIFPADLLDRLEVTKALTPNMEGDAIGGVVNMIMKDAPAKFSVKADGALGYSASLSNNDFQTFDHSNALNRSPRFTNGDAYVAPISSFPKSAFTYAAKSNPLATLLGLSVGGRLFNNHLGVLVSGSYQNNYRFVNSTFFKTDAQLNSNEVLITDIQQRKYSIQQQRTGINAKLDYKIDNNNKINLHVAYFNLLRNDMRVSSDTNLQLGRTIPGSGRVENSYHGIHDVQQVLNVNLNGDHNFGKGFGLNWAAVYSKASDNRPDEATLNLITGISVDPNSHQFVQAPLNIDQSSSREWRYSSDQDKSGYLNLNYDSKLGGNVKALWTVGGMYRNKERESHYDEYTLRPTNPSIQTYDGNISNNNFLVFNPQGTSDNALNYTATENVGAAYAMVKLTAGKLEVVGGARYENTDLSWTSNVSKTVLGQTGSITYYDVLPSVHFKYAITNKQALRLSYYSSISRPNFYEVVPHTILETDGDYTERGNPMLKRTAAENFDLRYEFFPRGLDQLLAGVFYKNLKNPIEYALEDKGTMLYYIPDNFGTARNLGFELDVTKYFRKFGVKANYTFTDSKITTTKVNRIPTANGGGTTEIVDQTRPLQGQSKHIANASLLFKDDNKLGLNAQLAFGYTSRRINTVSQFLDGDIWQKGFAQMDFSVEKRLAKRWYVYGKVNNLLNTPYQLEVLQTAKASNVTGVPYQKIGDNIFIRKDIYGINYLLGVKFKM